MRPACESGQVDPAIDDLWRYYDEHAAQARQHETLRATVTSILAGFSAALVGFAGVGGLERADAPAGVLLIVFGLLGALLSLKHYERNRFHTTVMGTVRGEIETLRANPKHRPTSPGALRQGAEQKHEDEFSLRRRKAGRSERLAPWLVRVRLAQLWAALPLAIAVVGVVVLIAALLSNQ